MQPDTESHSVSRSDLDFRNFVQLPCACLADAPPPGHFPPCKPPPIRRICEAVGSCKKEGSWCPCIWMMGSFRGQWLEGEKMTERMGLDGEIEERTDFLILGADLEPSTQQALT